MNSNEYKAQVYKKWLDSGQTAPTTREESDIVLEMQRRQTSKHKELERNKKQWDKYFVENQGKIPRTVPKSIFDKDE
jgi:uncharacterized protein YifE (UPF0438 family)